MFMFILLKIVCIICSHMCIVENMLLNIITILYAVHILIQQCYGLNFLELPGFQSDDNTDNQPVRENSRSIDDKRQIHSRETISSDNEYKKEQILGGSQSDSQLESQPQYPRIRTRSPEKGRRHWLVSSSGNQIVVSPSPNSNDKDAGLKGKIYRLVEQTIHDVDTRMQYVQVTKEKYNEQAPYKIGFILSMVKKSRDVLNELFNVAVKHRDEWKALEQLKIFELIVHTNVDTTNLVRQLVEIHIQHLNSTYSDSEKKGSHEEGERKNRVVLL